MRSLQEKFKNDLNVALKLGDELRVSTLRFLLSGVKNREIELRPLGKELTDDEVLNVLNKQVKQRNESIIEFEKAGREDLVEKESSELEILKTYLPEQMSEGQIQKLVDEALRETGGQSLSAMGKVMSVLMPKVKGRADGSVVSRIVREKLQSS
ncbi:GatB/YqeY domain-containing protein [candidate division WWE3 bacterium]|nr:GatB/YqeY domain-containing protein [candidate division WWE3 bacterium]